VIGGRTESEEDVVIGIRRCPYLPPCQHHGTDSQFVLYGFYLITPAFPSKGTP
jgi:hypothetical protein